MKVRPPTGQAWTPADSGGQDAEHRGLPAVPDGPDGPRSDPRCRSVSALIADALDALDREDVAAARAPLCDVADSLALAGG